MKNSFCIITCVLLLVSSAYSKESFESILNKSVNFLESNQFDKTSSLYWQGEWPVQMYSYFLPAVLGVGKPFAKPTEESTAFATSSIVNLISEAYLTKPTLTKIPSLIEKGMVSTNNYKNGSVYNYYNKVLYRNTVVSGPLDPAYVPNYIQGLTNIPSDADTTSVTYTALALKDLIFNNTPLNQFNLKAETVKSYSQHRDLNRSPHYYNRLDGFKNTGAYLTWFFDEKSAVMPRNLFAKPNQGQRIPFSVNDVDCVVNANVLRLLAMTNNRNSSGYKESCQFINKAILTEKQSQCGIYYPNSYAVFYTASNVFIHDKLCVEDSKEKAVNFILSTQNSDGSWSNEPGIGRTDQVQSTALAISALINYTKQDQLLALSSIRYGVRYLLRQMKVKSTDQVYWKGEVFFSAIAQARNSVLWRSDAYTTALVLSTLVKAEKVLNGEL